MLKVVKYTRASGILLHPTSLPGRYGLGDIGSPADEFLEFLSGAGQRLWQILPLGPTGYGDSPYQCYSAFAGNPLLISPELLRDRGLLTAQDLAAVPSLPEGISDYGAACEIKTSVLDKAFRAAHGSPALDAFRQKHAQWLPDFALFFASRDAHGAQSWHQWEPELRDRRPGALARVREQLAEEIARYEFAQWVFFDQWDDLRRRCRARGIELIGDIPIYVAHDSADVWTHPDLFHLDENGLPTLAAGVPPDYFSATGQLWGNPLYRWDMLAQTGYLWWIERVRATLQTVDRIRLDHFRGFEAYWAVPGSERTAVHGKWMKGPGAALFTALQKALGDLPLIAENLGLITPEVEALRAQFSLPGMSVLQFGFGPGADSRQFRPHFYTRETVAYTGTHDNDTMVGWWESLADNSPERGYAARLLQTGANGIHWAAIRAVLGSVADTAIIPLQDVLGLGNEARMNMPSSTKGNWQWRYQREMLTPAVQEQLRDLTELFDRGPDSLTRADDMP